MPGDKHAVPRRHELRYVMRVVFLLFIVSFVRGVRRARVPSCADARQSSRVAQCLNSSPQRFSGLTRNRRSRGSRGDPNIAALGCGGVGALPVRYTGPDHTYTRPRRSFRGSLGGCRLQFPHGFPISVVLLFVIVGAENTWRIRFFAQLS